jgi:hypothetical protein
MCYLDEGTKQLKNKNKPGPINSCEMFWKTSDGDKSTQSVKY